MAQVMGSDLLVESSKPVVNAFYDLRFQPVDWALQFTAGRRAHLKTAVDLRVDGIESPRHSPPRGNFIHVRCVPGHSYLLEIESARILCQSARGRAKNKRVCGQRRNRT